MCKITTIEYRKEIGIKLENEQLSVIIIPSKGGKAASILYKSNNFELLFQNGADLMIHNSLGDDFAAGDASGFDDAFPAIEKENVMVNGMNISYPDHGEIWTANMEYSVDGEVLILKYKSEILPYNYEKYITLKDNKVCYNYIISNTGDYEFPCIWAFHCLVRYEEDMKFIYPSDVQVFENVLPGRELGDSGQFYFIHNNHYDFYSVPLENSKTMVKYYAARPIHNGVCGYYYPSKKMECRIIYDETKLPYLGCFITAGGFRGDYNCALEPANGYYDSIETATKNGKCCSLRKGETLTFSIDLELNHTNLSM